MSWIKYKLDWIVLGALLLVALIPVVWIFSQSFFKMHDFTHIARVVEMDTAIRDGHVPPRWSKHLGYGYGMPLFQYYGPFPFFIAWSAMFVGGSAILSIKFLILMTQFIGVSGVFTYLRSRFGIFAATFGSIAFMFLPYRALDLYVRGALNELLAISILPWLLYGIDRVLKSNSLHSRWVYLFSIVLFSFLTTHNLSVLMAAPVLLIYAVIVWIEQDRSIKPLLHLAYAGVLGIGLSAFYFFPSYLEKDFTRVESLTGGYSHYDHHFLYIRQLFWGEWGFGGSIFGPEDGMSFMIGIPQLIFVIIGSTILLTRLTRKKFSLTKSRWIAYFFLVVFLGASFLTLFRSKPIWDAVTIMRYFQFPWRFHVLISLAVPILLAAYSSLLTRKKRIVLLIVGSLLFIGFNLQYFQPEELLDNPNHFYYTEPARISRDMSGILPDYQPTWMNTTPPEFEERVSLYPPDAGTISIEVDRTHELFAKIELQQDALVRFHVVYFPNWRVYLEGKVIEQEIVDEFGYQQIQLSEGTHNVSLVLEPTTTRMVSDVISVLSMVIVLGGLLYARRTTN